MILVVIGLVGCARRPIPRVNPYHRTYSENLRMAAAIIRTEMTPEEQQAALALAEVRFPPATFAKRFAVNMADIARTRWVHGITDKQRQALWQVVYTYRRQLPQDVVALSPMVAK